MKLLEQHNPKLELTGSFMQIYHHTSQSILDLILKMLVFNPNSRPNAKELLKIPIFDSIRVPQLEKKAPYKIYLQIDETF